MPVAPHVVDDLAAAVADIYREAESALLKLITDRLAQGMDAPRWAVERLTDVQPLMRAAGAVVAGLDRAGTAAVRQAVADGYVAGNAAAVADLADLIGQGVRGANKRVRRDARAAALDDERAALAVQALADAVVDQTTAASRATLRTVDDVYRRAVAGATARTLGGRIPQRDAAQSAWAALVSNGATAFTAADGRRWRLHSYVEMATRTACHRATVQALTDAMGARGEVLLYVPDRPRECGWCRPWEHKILSLDGVTGTRAVRHLRTGGYTLVTVAGTLDDAIAAGLLHPNCRHMPGLYQPGLTRLKNRGTADPAGNTAEERQREIERHIRGWRERELTALTPAGWQLAHAKVRQWEAAMGRHLTANPGLRRLRYREAIGAGYAPNDVDNPAALIGT